MLSEAIDTFNNKSISSLISTNYIFILWILKKKKKKLIKKIIFKNA